MSPCIWCISISVDATLTISLIEGSGKMVATESSVSFTSLKVLKSLPRQFSDLHHDFVYLCQRRPRRRSVCRIHILVSLPH